MLINGQGGGGDLGERHRSGEIFRTSSDGGLACGIESFDVVDELLLFNVTREPQPVVGINIQTEHYVEVSLTLHD